MYTQHVHKESVRNTGSPKAWSERRPTGSPRGTGRALWGGGGVRSASLRSEVGVGTIFRRPPHGHAGASGAERCASASHHGRQRPVHIGALGRPLTARGEHSLKTGLILHLSAPQYR